ncbi:MULTISPECIES: MFS transporter [Streptomyces]|uniref:MFS transporter n=1 Tax=Streptomyces TaxID=1883 RepID=UPI0002DD3427|nr:MULTISPECIES: MFS transporter [Streptomyces]MCX4522949.1 MFS transporter [Streptomyces anulatus]MCX4605960.1 MFS transporter [Streptomyces anulatus]WTD14264.1 MFS transporter [Streptomyces anulatus]WTD23670.1 MFS transporter [Streptomyces anulatus]WTE07575.1 MFS transporter [Streptomyces anulatus]
MTTEHQDGTDSATAEPPWNLRAVTWLSGTQFFMFGIAIGVMTVAWAEVIRSLDLSDGFFGTAHLLLPVVGLLTLLAAKRIYRYLDHRWIGIYGQLALIGLLVMLAVSDHFVGLLIAFVLAGLGSALVDTATNSVFMEIQARGGREVMNMMYAINSGGTVISALGAGALISLGMDYRWVAVLFAVIMAPVLLASFVIKYPPVNQDEPEETPSGSEAEGDIGLIKLMRNPLFRVVFVMTVLGIAVESIVQVWSVIYVDQLLDAPIVYGGAAFALFSLTMMIGRMINAWLVASLGIRRSFLISAIGTALSGALLMGAFDLWLSVFAFLLMGIAIAGVQPTCLSAAARVAPSRVNIVAAAMMVPAYAAFIATPTAYGWLSDATSLNTAMVLVVAAGVGVGVLALSRPIAEADRAAAAPAETGDSTLTAQT